LRRLLAFGLVLMVASAALWWDVYASYQQRKQVLIRAWTDQQVQLTRAVARAIQEGLRLRLEMQGWSRNQAEPDVFRLIIEPVRLRCGGDVWLHHPTSGIVSRSLPPAYQGKTIREIFELQNQQGAWHYEELCQRVMSGVDGMGWYVWSTEKGRQIATWTPLKVGEESWVLGISISETEILDDFGSAGVLEHSVVGAGLINLLLLGGFLSLALRRRDDQAQVAILERTVAERTAELTASEARYRTVVEHAREGIAIIEVTSHRLLFANPALAAVFGIADPGDMLGQDLFDFFGDEDRRRAEKRLGDVYGGAGLLRHSYEAHTLQGIPIWLEVSSSNIEFDGHPGALMLIADVTERKHAEQHSAYQARLLREVNDAIIATDLAFHITAWNQAAERMYGWAAEEVIGKEISTVIPVKLPNLTRQELRQEILSRGCWEGMALHYNKEGAELEIDWSIASISDTSGKAIGLVAINRDVTDRARAERAVAEAHDRLLTVFDSMEALVYVANMDTHEVLFANKYVRDLFGDDLLGKPCRQVIQSGQCGPCESCDQHQLLDADGEPAGTRSWEFQAADHGLWCATRERAIRWVDGRMVRLAIATDITERKRAEEALRQSEQCYRSVFENTGTATIIIEADTTISAINAEFEKLGGYAGEEVEGKMLWTSFVAPKDLGRMKDYHERRGRGDATVPDEYEFCLVDKLGIEKDIFAKACVIPGTSRSIASMTDITAHKRAREILSASEKRLRKQNQVLVELAKSKALSLGDLDTALLLISAAAAQTVEVNRASIWLYNSDRTKIRCVQQYSTSAGASVGGPELTIAEFPAYFSALEKNRVIEAHDAHTDTRTREFVETYLIPRGITSMLDAPIWLGGQIVGVVGHEHVGPQRRWSHEEQQFAGSMADLVSLVLEAHERQRTAEALRQSEERYRELADLLPQPVFETDVRGNITFANRNAFESFSYSREDLLGGLNVMDMVIPEDRRRAEINMKRALRIDRLETTGEYSALRKDGSTFPFIVCVNRIVHEKQTVGLRGIVVDLTERKRTEAELLNIQRLESIAVLAGGIAHDFNNLLTAILGNISLAQLHTSVEGQLLHLLNEAEKASLRAKELSHRLLTFSKGGSPLKKTTALGELAKETVALALIDRKVKAEFAIADDLWMADCDPVQMGQVITNLVINASEAMPQGGTVSFTVGNVLPGQDQALSGKKGKHIKLTVADRGVGIPDEFLSRIFDPYFTTKPLGAQKGSGLGLSIVHSIIKKHDGIITVASRQGIGSVFAVYLPASPMEPAMGAEQWARARSSKGRILVMDDEETVREVLGTLLEFLGYEAQLVKDGTEAIDAYRVAMESGRSFSAVIMDLTIRGGMGGRETIQRLMALDPEAKAIITSGYANDPIMFDYNSHGFCGVVAKPYKIQQLDETLRSVLQENG
jgi:PAS domain S-box-containing protein